jgi:predicted methyltransferase
MFRTARAVCAPLLAVTAAVLAGLTLAACSAGPPAASKAAAAAPGAPRADLRSIDAAIAAQRFKGDTEEDAYRKPREVLEFVGVRPGMKVIDVVAGRGYYTELLARAVGPTGEVTAYNRADVSRMADALNERYGNGRLPNVKRLEVDRPAVTFAPASHDAAILIKVYHDFYLGPPNGPPADPAPFVAKLFAALKPGGVAVVEDHSADAGGAPAEVARTLHRIDPEIVKRDFIAAGFRFDAASDAVRNPADDHKLPVRDAAAHQTDRMLLRFRKP